MFKYLTSIPKNLCNDKLADIVNECSNTFHKTIRMKPVDVNSSTYIDLGLENNEKHPKFEVADHVRIPK